MHHTTAKIGLEPTRESRLGVNAGRTAAVPPQRTFSHPVMSGVRTPASGAHQVPFNRPDSGRMDGGRTPEQHEAQGSSRGGFGSTAPGRNVPRPPDATLRSGADRNTHGTVNEANNRPEGTGDRGGFGRSGSNVPRPPNATLHSGADRNMRAPESGTPRSGAINNGTGSADRGSFSRPAGTTNVPRPPANNNGGGNGGMNAPRSGGTDRSAPTSRPAPTERSTPPSGNNGRSEQHSDSPRSPRQSDSGPRSMNVPRPTGPVRQASNQSYDYRSSQANRGYSAPNRGSYSQAPRSYGSNDRGSYSQSPRSYGSYGGQRSSSSSPRTTLLR